MIEMEMSETEDLPPIPKEDEPLLDNELEIQLAEYEIRKAEDEIRTYFNSTYDDLDLSSVEENIFVGGTGKGINGAFNFDKIKDDFSKVKTSKHRFLIRGEKFNYFRCNFRELVLYYSLGGPNQKQARNLALAYSIVNTPKETAEQEERKQHKNLILGETVGTSLLRKLDYILNVLSETENIPIKNTSTHKPNYNKDTTERIIKFLRKKYYSDTETPQPTTTAGKKRKSKEAPLRDDPPGQQLRIGTDAYVQSSNSTAQNAILAPVVIQDHLGNITGLNEPGDYTFEGVRQVSWGDLRVGDAVYRYGNFVGYVSPLRTGNDLSTSEPVSDFGSLALGGLPSPVREDWG